MSIEEEYLLSFMKPNHFFQLGDTWLTEKQFVVRDDVLFRKVGKEGIVLHLTDGVYYSLSETSILFWEALSEGYPLEVAVNKITSEYDIELEKVIQELQIFLKSLLEYNLIKSSSPAV